MMLHVRKQRKSNAIFPWRVVSFAVWINFPWESNFIVIGGDTHDQEKGL